jgi:hypothetical protein
MHGMIARFLEERDEDEATNSHFTNASWDVLEGITNIYLRKLNLKGQSTTLVV